MSLLRALKKNLFEPPYRLLPLAVFAFFAVSFGLHPQSPLHTHQLFDPDDYMRLNEVINWLQSAHPFGAGWYDLGQPRLSPGEHVTVHWARLVDLPIAFFMLPFIHAFGMQNAAIIASFIVPPLLFGFLLMLAPALARPLVGKNRANLAAAFLLFAPDVVLNFMPGRVDHHGYQIIIGAFGLLCLERMVLCPRGWKAAIAAAIAFACGLWIGTEALPWLMLFVAGLAMFASLRGGFAARNAAIFGIALPLAVAAVMTVALEPAEYASRALSWFSGADLIFALLAGSVLVFGWIGGRLTEKTWLRFALISALGFCAGLLFVSFVPDILTGAYADYDAFFNDTLVGNIGEAQPLAPAMRVNSYVSGSFTHAAMLFLHHVFLPLLATVVVLWNFFRTKSRTRALWFLHGLFLVPALLLMLFWQVRIGWFAQIFCIAPVTWLAWRCWERIAARGLKGRTRFWAEIAAFLLIAPLPVVLLPAMMGRAVLYPDLMLFPAARAAPVCPLLHAADFLDEAYGDHPRVIVSGANEGPELLFRTPHEVLAAPYNVDGNADAFAFFNARDERQAVKIVLKRHVDLVLVCRNIPPFYAGLASFQQRFNAYLSMDRQGHLRMSSSRDHPTLIERLVDGDIPLWLKPVAIPLDPDYLLFEVNK